MKDNLKSYLLPSHLLLLALAKVALFVLRFSFCGDAEVTSTDHGHLFLLSSFLSFVSFFFSLLFFISSHLLHHLSSSPHLILKELSFSLVSHGDTMCERVIVPA